jgi:hypothetical protein
VRMFAYIKIGLEIVADACLSVLVIGYSRNIVKRVAAA